MSVYFNTFADFQKQLLEADKEGELKVYGVFHYDRVGCLSLGNLQFP